ncbi:HtaA domain-containing protein [Microbacterium sp. H1-D42]|uniref:HtaA domain-containing protein n=1 Tax=Microbacterium sp. H1-D42 TaxID=2925844 RepID=UPI001F534420|nr:HtaA domain-containing protein [Microbacterium sp. H1-D42]UNK70041.1 HtaA domain-containing protein [Microbacterium sp. H1-D42]
MNNFLRMPALLLAAGAVLAGAAPTSAAATTTVTAAGSGVCTVSSGTLTWGVKESFRSYISGSIAKGEWQAADGAEYATPEFTFTAPTGELDAETGAGTVTFAGTVHFTGHGGVLDMTLGAPQIVIAEDGSATLHLDVRSNDTSGELALDEKQAEVAALDAPVAVDTDAGTLAVASAPMTLTEAGAPAFGGFYQAGDELDPVTLDVALACATDEPEEPAEQETPAPSTTEASAPIADDGINWLPIALGGGTVAVAAAAGAVLLVRRRGGS